MVIPAQLWFPQDALPDGFEEQGAEKQSTHGSDDQILV